jgi:hypothetical protein
MTEKKTQVITINDKEYNADDLTNEQKLMVNHCTDLDRKMASAQFNLDQLRVGKDAFVSMLSASLETTTEDGNTIEAAE